MSDDRQFERNARSWLELGPIAAPDRVVEDALRTIEATPQVRESWLPRKGFRISNQMRLATAAAVGVIVIGGGLLLRGPSAQVGTPSPRPSNSASPLLGQWVSVGKRQDPDLGIQYPSFLIFSPTSLRMDTTMSEFVSSWSTGPDGLILELQTPQAELTSKRWDGCSTRDRGTYTVGLSSDARTLTLAPTNDPCATRAGILVGSWTRTSCVLFDGACEPPATEGPTQAAGLAGQWRSTDPRDAPYAAPNFEDLIIDASTFRQPEVKADVISSWSIDVFQLATVTLEPGPAATGAAWWPCHAGDVGTYWVRWSARIMTLTLQADACAVRARVLAGDWTRTDIGALTPGPHTSPLFRPFDAGTTGSATYTVPAGWAEYWENSTLLSLGLAGSSNQPAIFAYSNMLPSSYDASCRETGPSVARTAAAIAAWLATVPGIVVVTPPTPVTIGGLQGLTIDLAAAPGWTNRCEFSSGSGPEGSFGPVYDSPAYTFTDPDGARLSLSGGTRATYVLLDEGDGQVLVIDVEATTKENWGFFRIAAMPVINSFEFTR